MPQTSRGICGRLNSENIKEKEMIFKINRGQNNKIGSVVSHKGILIKFSMDANQRILPLLSLLLLVSSSCFITASSETVSEEKKVTLELYYETLCPYCSRFIVNYLYTIFDTGVIDITNLKLIPYGNAKIRSNGTIICQHGQYECLLNTVEACAIAVWPDVNEHFPYIYCVESLVYNGDYTQWETCFEKLGLDPKPVSDCYKTEQGTQLELRYAVETNALQPPHKYVPWVVVDGEPLYDDYRNFISYICKAYKGTPVPPACSEYSANAVQQKAITNIIAPVCYTGTVKSIFSGIISAVRSWMEGVTMAALA